MNSKSAFCDIDSQVIGTFSFCPKPVKKFPEGYKFWVKPCEFRVLNHIHRRGIYFQFPLLESTYSLSQGNHIQNTIIINLNFNDFIYIIRIIPPYRPQVANFFTGNIRIIRNSNISTSKSQFWSIELIHTLKLFKLINVIYICSLRTINYIWIRNFPINLIYTETFISDNMLFIRQNQPW